MRQVVLLSLWRLGLVVVLLAGCSSGDKEPPTKSSPEPPVAAQKLTDQQRCLALAMYWEAKGEGKEGMQAVGHVVMNRVAHAGFPDTLCSVTQEGGEKPGCQFSWWCDGRSDVPVEPKPWAIALQLALDLPKHKHEDITKGAIFFHATRIKLPWKKQRTRTVTIGRHVFYK